MTRIGELGTYVKLQKPSTGIRKDAGGAPQDSSTDFSTYAKVWAKRVDNRGLEDRDGGREQPSLVTTWRMRHRDDVNARHRLIPVGSTAQVYDIEVPMDPTGRGRWLDVETERRGP